MIFQDPPGETQLVPFWLAVARWALALEARVDERVGECLPIGPRSPLKIISSLGLTLMGRHYPTLSSALASKANKAQPAPAGQNKTNWVPPGAFRESFR